MTDKDNIKKVLALCVDSICDDCPYADTKDCYNQIKLDARELIIKQENEIEKLKAENIRLTTKLGQVLLSIDTVKEMNAMCNIAAQVKQAKIDVLNALKDKMFEREYMGVKYKERIFYESEIDDMIAEVQNAEDKS
mgnify:CR=1 FL=1